MNGRRTGLVLTLAGSMAACSEPTVAGAAADANKEPSMTSDSRNAGPPARSLPYSHGRTFATLDEYLAHLRQYAGPVGQPWYREIRPGVYELVTTLRPPREPETYTREQLMARFGFNR